MRIKTIELKPFIIKTIKEEIKEESRLIESISVSLKKSFKRAPTETLITIKLKDDFCFAPDFLESTKTYWSWSIFVGDDYKDIQKELKHISHKIKEDLWHVDCLHKPLWVDVDMDEIKTEELDGLSYSLFKQNFSDLNKYQRSFICTYLGQKKITSGDEFLKHLERFMFTNKHFPFKYEKLYKTYEYAIKMNLLTEEHFIKIEELKNICRKEHSQLCLNQLIDFCTKNKRWIYATEKEMVNCIKYIYHYYSFDWYNEKECQEIDNLFNMYANNESKGELMVNTCLVKLGYNIKKQFTFDDCKAKRKLPFDTMFYVDETLCLIEFDGEQHFKSIDYFGGDEHLKYVQTHDEIKNEYCQKNNIPLLRIKYDEINKIDELIQQFIHSVKTSISS